MSLIAIDLEDTAAASDRVGSSGAPRTVPLAAAWRRRGIATEAVERSLFEHLAAAMALDGVRVHRAGENESDGRSELWVEPRLLRFARSGPSRNGAECYPVALAIRVYRKASHKGGRFRSLGQLVDRVRFVVDATTSAPAARIVDPTTRALVAILEWGHAGEVRTFGVAVDIDGVAHPGFDVSTLTVECILSSSA